MSNVAKPVRRHRVWSKLWKPFLITGAGGAAIAVWLDDILTFAEELVGVILLPIMAGVIYLLDILMFRSRMPRQSDLEDPDHKGAKK